MTTQYVEIDSLSRDRNQLLDNTGPGNFITQTDYKAYSDKFEKKKSLDPISDEVEIVKWTRSEFMLNTSIAATEGINLIPFTKKLPGNISYSASNPSRLILTSVTDDTSGTGVGGLQPSKNYYWGATINVDSPASSAKIIYYEYLGSNKCIIKVDSPLVLTNTSKLQIVDPTTNHDSTTTAKDDSLLFVPGGRPSYSLIGGHLTGITDVGKKHFTIISHDTIQNTIKIHGDDVTSNYKIIPTSNLTIRIKLPRILHDKPTNFINNFDMDTLRGGNNVFGFSGSTDISNVDEGDFLEISSDTQHGVATVSGATNNKFTISGSAPSVQSDEDNVYIGCNVRLTMSNTSSPFYFTSEDRTVTSYVGNTNLITVDREFNNDISTYNTLHYVMFFKTEAKTIQTKINLSATSYDSFSSIPAGNIINLLNYTAAPGAVATDAKYDVTAAKSALGDYYNQTKSLAGTYINVDTTGGSVFAYGYVTSHTVSVFSDDPSIVKYNYITVNPAFYTSCIGIAEWPLIHPKIGCVILSSPFIRNPYPRYDDAIDSDRYSVLAQTDDNYSPLVSSGGGVVKPTGFTEDKCNISLINLILPNKPLKNSKGGYITEYPFVYVRFSNTHTSTTRSFLSNNRIVKNLGVDFKVMIDNTVDDQTTPFVVLKGGDIEQLQVLSYSKDIQFAVYLPDGSLFETVEIDKISPWASDQELQISALFKVTFV
jgi:hypothetical protein